MKEVFLEKKWIEAEKSIFLEELEPKSNKKNYFLKTLILPFNKKSRNGNVYNKESALQTKNMIKGIPLMHNHITTGPNVFSKGEWLEAWEEEEGLYGKAIVYNTPANKEYIEWLAAQDNPKVSLQVSANAKQRKEESTGKYFVEAFITDWIEISTVNAPGFIDAKGKLEVAMSECFGNCSFKESMSKADEKDAAELKAKTDKNKSDKDKKTDSKNAKVEPPLFDKNDNDDDEPLNDNVKSSDSEKDCDDNDDGCKDKKEQFCLFERLLEVRNNFKS